MWVDSHIGFKLIRSYHTWSIFILIIFSYNQNLGIDTKTAFLGGLDPGLLDILFSGIMLIYAN